MHMLSAFTACLAGISLLPVVEGQHQSGEMIYVSTLPDDSAATGIFSRASEPYANETLVVNLGEGYGAFWTEASATSASHLGPPQAGGGMKYFATLQKRSGTGAWAPADSCAPHCDSGSLCCSDPRAKGKGGGACYNVSACSAIKDPTPLYGVTVAVDLAVRKARVFNSSTCWKLALGQDGSSLLCMFEDGGNETYGGQLHVSRIGLESPHEETRIGSFPANHIVMNDAGCFDVGGGMAYALTNGFDDDDGGLGGGTIFGLDLASGKLALRAQMPGLPSIQSLDYDASGARLLAVAQLRGGGVSLGVLQSAGAATLNFKAKCNIPFAGYAQINDGRLGYGAQTFFSSVYKVDGALQILGTNVSSCKTKVWADFGKERNAIDFEVEGTAFSAVSAL